MVLRCARESSAKTSFTADLYDPPMIQTPPEPMQHPSLNALAPVDVLASEDGGRFAIRTFAGRTI